MIDSAEAKVVTFIFRQFMSGNSLGKISDALARRGTLRMANACRRIGLVNDCGEAPLLIKRYHKTCKTCQELSRPKSIKI